MKSPIIRKTGRSRKRSDERGITIAVVAIAMVSIIGVAMLAIDLVTLFLAREEAQRSADTAALAAARVISVSGITGTATPTTDTTYWQSICGPAGIATQAALSTAGENSVSSTSADTVTVRYALGTGVLASNTNDCSTLGAGAAVNPMVVVTVTRNNLPTFFSRYFGYGGQSATSVAVAEAFNPSASDLNTNGGAAAVTPVQPRCVKPWIVPNRDPGNASNKFVSLTDGSIVNKGVSTGGGSASGVIGETLILSADCQSSPVTSCVLVNPSPQSTPPSSLQYLPGAVGGTPVAVPACAASGTGSVLTYIQAVAGCDQNTNYQCGQPLSGFSPTVDLSENPGGSSGDTAMGLACVETYPQSALPLAGQDVLNTATFPFTITTGSANPLKITANTQVTASNQIVSLPIYDDTAVGTLSTSTPVPIVGFLQVFVNGIDVNGNVNVTVLNVAGCGDAGDTNSPVTGSSPVPVRLITPP